MADFNKKQSDRKQGDNSRVQPGSDRDRNRGGQNPDSSQPGNQAPNRDDQTGRENKREKGPSGSQADEASEIDAEEQPDQNRNL